jgi:Na+/H+-translocating membrane pyrophosphatase
VGDCAGQAADLFESISAEILSAMILGGTLAHEARFASINVKVTFILFPLAVHCLDIIASTVGIFAIFTAGMLFVRTKPGLPQYDASYGEIEDPLYVMKRVICFFYLQGYRYAMVIGILGFIYICYEFLNPKEFPKAWFYFSICGMIGVAVSFLFIEVTQYYTDYHHAPVKSIVYASKTGYAFSINLSHATNIIQGLAVGLESTALPILIISVGVLLAHNMGEMTGIVNQSGAPIGGLFGTAVATMGMFCT